MTHADDDFAQAYASAEHIDGWLTEAQARVLFDEARRIAPARVVEIGSHLGRSTVVLGATGAEITAIDPFGAQWRYGADDTEARFRQHLRDAGVTSAVDVRVATSREARQHWAHPLRLVYIDGKHDYWSCLDDLSWAAWLGRGDRILVHDAFSSLGVTLALLRHTLTTREHTYLDRTGSLARLEVRRPRWRDRLRVLGELPWFARNLLIKVLLRARLRAIAAALGHRDSADPY